MTNKTGKKILNLSQKHWPAHAMNCSGLVKAVANDLGIQLTGTANTIMDTVKSKPWIAVKDGITAKRMVEQEGYFVIAGKKENTHGHVVIIVPGPLDWRGKNPTAYWGNLGRQIDTTKPVNTSAKQYGTLNWAWSKKALADISYHAIKIKNSEQGESLPSLLSQITQARAGLSI